MPRLALQPVMSVHGASCMGAAHALGRVYVPVDVMPAHAPIHRANTCSTAVNPLCQQWHRRRHPVSADPIHFPMDGIERADLLAIRGTGPSPTGITHAPRHPTQSTSRSAAALSIEEWF